MEKIEESLRKFCDVFGRNGSDGLHGQNLKFNPGRGSDYPIELPVSPELLSLYSNVEFSDVPTIGGFLQIEIQEPKYLLRAQEGWRFISDNGGPLYDNPSWNSCWVVFAMHHGDAIVADTSVDGTPVYGSIQQRSFKISSSLALFLDVISDCMQCEFAEFNMDIDDQDYEPKAEFVEKIKTILNKLETSESEGFTHLFFG